MDVADLEVQDIGKLECRWVAPGEDFVTIPAEVRSDGQNWLHCGGDGGIAKRGEVARVCEKGRSRTSRS